MRDGRSTLVVGDDEAAAGHVGDEGSELALACGAVYVVVLHQRGDDGVEASRLIERFPDLRRGLVEVNVGPRIGIEQNGLVRQAGGNDVVIAAEQSGLWH